MLLHSPPMMEPPHPISIKADLHILLHNKVHIHNREDHTVPLLLSRITETTMPRQAAIYHKDTTTANNSVIVTRHILNRAATLHIPHKVAIHPTQSNSTGVATPPPLMVARTPPVPSQRALKAPAALQKVIAVLVAPFWAAQQAVFLDTK